MKKTEMSPCVVDTVFSEEDDILSDEEALKRFLLDIDCLDQLDE